jgi:hypothetical protein
MSHIDKESASHLLVRLHARTDTIAAFKRSRLDPRFFRFRASQVDRNEPVNMTVSEPAKTVDHYDERMAAALEAKTPLEEVKFDEVDVNVHVHRSDRQLDQSGDHSSWKRRTILVFLVLVIGLIAAAAVLAVLLEGRGDDASTGNTSSLNLTQFAEEIPQYSREAAQRNSSSPQALALAFVQSTASSYDSFRLKQRYALSVLNYSTSLADVELEGENECDWFWQPKFDYILETTWDQNHEICDTDKRYLLLVLDNALSFGVIPAELEMLTNLKYLNLARNPVTGNIPRQL